MLRPSFTPWPRSQLGVGKCRIAHSYFFLFLGQFSGCGFCWDWKLFFRGNKFKLCGQFWWPFWQKISILTKHFFPRVEILISFHAITLHLRPIIIANNRYRNYLFLLRWKLLSICASVQPFIDFCRPKTNLDDSTSPQRFFYLSNYFQNLVKLV